MELQLTGYVLLKNMKFFLSFFFFFTIFQMSFKICLFLDIAKITNNNRESIINFKSKLCFRGTGSSDDIQILSECIFNGLQKRQI